MSRLYWSLMLLALVCYIGCTQPTPESETGGGGEAEIGAPDTPETDPGDATAEPADQASTGTIPVFTVVTSEYQSWVTLVVAGKAGIVNPARGGDMGPLEQKYGIDVVVEFKDYDSCITLYANGTADASCLTNIDSLNPALGRATTAFCPTSTSDGADKVIAVGITKPEELKGMKVYGLKKSVSEYTFVRGLEKQSLNPADFEFVNLAPEAAAQAIQTGSNDTKAICVWNPYAIQTLNTTSTSKEIFSSNLIKGEIIDQMVIGNDVLAKPKGEDFAKCLIEMQYAVCKNLWSDDATVKDTTRTAWLADCAPDLPPSNIDTMLTETSFFKDATAGIAVYSNPGFPDTMKTVVATAKALKILEDKEPTIGYNDPNAQLNFTTKYMEAVATK